MPRFLILLAFATLLAGPPGLAAREARTPKPTFTVEALPPLPVDLRRFQLGRDGNTLIVAGGSTPDGVPVDSIHTTDLPSGTWREAGRLPAARAFGAGASDGAGLYLVGGEIDGHPTASVLRIGAGYPEASVRELPGLPEPLRRPAAAVAAGRLYVAGTLTGEGSPRSVFWSLDLAHLEAGWTALPVWPGAARVAPTLVFAFESLHLVGGEADGLPVHDAFAYHLLRGWRPMAPPPAWGPDTAAAPVGESHILAFGATVEDGVEARILAYHDLTDRWVEFGRLGTVLPAPPKAVAWADSVIVMSGPAVTAIRILPPENNYGWPDHIVVVLYLLGMVGMGAWFVRQEKDTKDYFRAGNRAPWWAIGMSLFATYASAISLMTMPSKSYSTDWTYFSITIFSALCLPILLFLLAPLVRKLEISTANEYLELRFGIVARIVGSVIYMINQILARSAPVIFLPSIAMSAITGIDIWIWILVIGIVTTLYTFLGGLAAVIWTDTVQGIIMLCTVSGCLALILFQIDMPPGEIWNTLRENDKFHTFDWQPDITYPTAWMVFIGTIFITLLQVSDQNFVQRVQAAPSLKDAKKAVATQIGVAVPINLLLFALGTGLYLYYRQYAGELNPLMKTDGIYPLFAAQQLPPGVSGLVIAALLAASMSTISSAICSVANLGVDDFYRRFRRDASEESALRLGRILSITVGVISVAGALYLSQTDSKSIWDLALMISGLITNGTVGLFGLGLLTKRAHELGALLGVAAGTSVVFWLQNHTPVTFWLYAAIGSVVTFVVGYVLSLALPGSANHVDGLTVYTLDKPRPRL